MAYLLHTIHWKHLQMANVLCQNVINVAFILGKNAANSTLRSDRAKKWCCVAALNNLLLLFISVPVFMLHMDLHYSKKCGSPFETTVPWERSHLSIASELGESWELSLGVYTRIFWWLMLIFKHININLVISLKPSHRGDIGNSLKSRVFFSLHKSQ